MNNISFLSENFQFLEVKFSIYLNRCVFVVASTIITDEYFSYTYLPGTFILSSRTKNVSKLFSPANRVRVGHWYTWIWRVQGLYESADGQSAIRDGMYQGLYDYADGQRMPLETAEYMRMFDTEL